MSMRQVKYNNDSNNVYTCDSSGIDIAELQSAMMNGQDSTRNEQGIVCRED